MIKSITVHREPVFANRLLASRPLVHRLKVNDFFTWFKGWAACRILAVFYFLLWNYRYKSVAIQIPRKAGFERLP